MTQHRQPWPAITYPEMPAQLSPEQLAHRSYVRIGVKVALLTLPLMLVAGFTALSDHGSGPQYDGYQTAQAVMKLTKTTEIVFCEDAPKAAGAVSDCAAKPSSGPGDIESFGVRFVDNHGDFTVDWPNGRTLKGTVGA